MANNQQDQKGSDGRGFASMDEQKKREIASEGVPTPSRPPAKVVMEA